MCGWSERARLARDTKRRRDRRDPRPADQGGEGRGRLARDTRGGGRQRDPRPAGGMRGGGDWHGIETSRDPRPADQGDEGRGTGTG